MYYPIIDKLKEVMAELTSVKEKEPLIIEGTLTSATGGTWTGNYSDISSAFSNNKQVLFKIVVQGETALVPIIDYNTGFSTSVCFPFKVGGSVVITYGAIIADNTFALHVMS